jgi:acetolactate synthase I/II/III large subunit
MYTISTLWTHAREHLNITTGILKNSSYGILREEWTLLKHPGQRELHDSPLTNLDGVNLDFVGLATAMGDSRRNRRRTRRPAATRPRGTWAAPH